MIIDPVLPDASEQLAVASDQPADAPVLETDAKPEGTEESKGEAEKPAKTEEQRSNDRMQRKIDRLVRQREELRAQLGNRQDLRQAPIGDTNQSQQNDSETLSLSRAELAAMVKAEATKLAPAIKQQEVEIEHRKGVVASLAKQWGAEKFDSLAADLDEAIGGLADRSGRPRPVADAIFESSTPAALIEYLANDENSDEAEALARMTPMQVGRAVERLELKLKAAADKAKPVPSKAGAPLEPLRSESAAPNGMPDPKNVSAYVAWANKRDAAARSNR